MKIVRVQYTTSADYAARNTKNINSVVEELQGLNHPGIRYSAFLAEDGKTFMHFDQFENEAAHEVLQELRSFKVFAAELEASILEKEPVLDLLTLAASTENFFGK
jgi:hypothetical protein